MLHSSDDDEVPCLHGVANPSSRGNIPFTRMPYWAEVSASASQTAERSIELKASQRSTSKIGSKEPMADIIPDLRECCGNDCAAHGMQVNEAGKCAVLEGAQPGAGLSDEGTCSGCAWPSYL